MPCTAPPTHRQTRVDWLLCLISLDSGNHNNRIPLQLQCNSSSPSRRRSRPDDGFLISDTSISVSASAAKHRRGRDEAIPEKLTPPTAAFPRCLAHHQDSPGLHELACQPRHRQAERWASTSMLHCCRASHTRSGHVVSPGLLHHHHQTMEHLERTHGRPAWG
jgi:hypothetical protein